jgi:23S rRNA (uracil1939-C5)-methyltransferase
MSLLIATIEDLATDGRGVARLDGRAVFVERALPGDRVKLELIAGSQPPAARVVELLDPSADRCAHPCPHAAECAGSIWGNLNYARQLEIKRGLIARTLRKFIGETDVRPLMASPQEWHYRSRITVRIWRQDGKLRFGYSPEARAEAGIPIATCALAAEPIDRALRTLTPWLMQQDFAEAPQKIQLHATANGAGLLLIFPTETREKSRRLWIDAVTPLISGGVWAMSGTRAGIPDTAYKAMQSDNALPMRMTWRGEALDVHPAMFCQANSGAAELVMERLTSLGKERKFSRIWDLYGGFGGLGLALAQNDSEVTALEISPYADEIFKTAAAKCGVERANFISGDLLKTLPQFVRRMQTGDAVVLDPPRGGAHPEVMRMIGSARTTFIAYLSCNPARLGRDLVPLMKTGFRLREIQPYDFFPQTPSMEVLAVLER